MKRPAIWSARCKSGYVLDRRRGRPTVCKQVCSRGELLCGDCATAVVVPDAVTVSVWGRMLGALRVRTPECSLPATLCKPLVGTDSSLFQVLQPRV
jgi:hypothetical protein